MSNLFGYVNKIVLCYKPINQTIFTKKIVCGIC